MNYSSLTDESLILLITRGHAEALSELYDRYSRLVFSLALHMVNDTPTAEEITLDVFTRVWQKADTYRAPQARPATWLTSLTRHRAIDVLRQRNTRAGQAILDWPDEALHALPGGPDPAALTELALQREQVRAAVAELSPDQRQVLQLAYFKGYTHRQIADLLNQPLGTVKTRIRLAMNKLRQLLPHD